MANVIVENTKLTALNDFKALTANDATETTDAAAQKFIFTPTGKDNHTLILASCASADGLSVTVSGGERVFALGNLTDAIAAEAGLYAMQLETGRYMKSDGTIEISFKPPAGKDLVNDLALKVYVCEMLPN
jgi:hypothetical protein